MTPVGKTIGIAGLGLIGGSLAGAIKRYVPAASVFGYDKDEDTANKALGKKYIDSKIKSYEELVNSCDILYLTSNISSIIEHITYLHSIAKELIISDVASVKRNVLKAASTLPGSKIFVGGHPMAGKEVGGIDNANPDIFKNAPYILCPSKTGTIPEILLHINQRIGSRSIILTPEDHDLIVSYVSHIPQILTVSLLNIIADLNEITKRNTQEIAGRAFMDFTRTGSSPSDIWTEIFKENKININDAIGVMIKKLESFKVAVESGDERFIEEVFGVAGSMRRDINKLQ